MAQCRTNPKVKESLRVKTTNHQNKDTLCDTSCKDTLTVSSSEKTVLGSGTVEGEGQSPLRATSSIKLRSINKAKAYQLPDVGKTGPPATTHSNMKTKQSKEDSDKSIDEETVEPKTRARKKASDIIEEDKNKPGQDEPKTSKEPKKNPTKPKVVVKKRPMGIRKTLRSKKTVISKDKVKTIIKHTVKRGRKAAVKPEPDNSQEKETVPLIPASEIKKEPLEDTTPNSRSSSPRTAGRRQRLSSDMVMMKNVLGDSPSSLVIGPRTSPYPMRSERSNSPSLFEGKNLRSGKPRKVKNNLLNEVVKKEQNKRRRLLSDSKTTDPTESSEEFKKLKRGRSCSKDGSEISKCSDVTESDVSLNEPLNDADSKELNKKLDKPKTDLDIDIENNVQISSIEKVPSLNVDCKLADTKQDTESSKIITERNKNKLSLKRSTSLDSDNNNSNRLKLDNLNSSDVEDKSRKTENDTLFEERSSILTSMSKTFNSKEVSKNMRRARRGRKVAAATRASPSAATKNDISSVTNDTTEDKQETLESLSKEIDDLINNLDQNIDGDHEMTNDSSNIDNTSDQMQTKTVSKFYGLSKPLGDNNSIISPETPVKDKDALTSIANESTPTKTDDSENIRLHYEEDSLEKSSDSSKQEKTYKCSNVASIDLLMDRLKEFEEFDKRRQRQESESKSSDGKTVMVTSDVVLIPKSGADIKPLKDMQTMRSPEIPVEKENVLSCFENNSAISIVKRDQVRRSIDLDLPNSVTLIKRNSISARKESTSSNHSKESDAISIFEKSLGKDVTLTEIRKSVDRVLTTHVDLHQFATLHPNNPSQALVGTIDTNQVSITTRVISDVKTNSSDNKRTPQSLKTSESSNDLDEKMPIIEKLKSPPHQMLSPAVSITPAPVAVKSPEATQPMETEALAPPLENVKTLPELVTLTTELSEVPTMSDVTKVVTISDDKPETSKIDSAKLTEVEPTEETEKSEISNTTEKREKLEVTKPLENLESEKQEAGKIKTNEKPEEIVSLVPSTSKSEPIKAAKPVKTIEKSSKSARNSTEAQPGPSNVLHETPESQKRKENVLRTLGLLTHKAAKEAKIEKLKEKERIYGQSHSGMMSKSKVAKSGSGDYTGTLKTVIKLNRSSGERERKKYRSSLKMTFQKSKNRSGKPPPDLGDEAAEDDAYYTIERREGGAGTTSDDGEAAPEPEPKETLNLVIPEKASSFSIHPGRLCMDQCFYCGGKFGLFDTPCHIAQMKSSERQKKVLDNEEKLTIDSCLCDACYRHVDRRANCPSYRKRPPPKQPGAAPTSPPLRSLEKRASPPLEDDSSSESVQAGVAGVASVAGVARPAACHTEGCTAAADHSIRRKWLIKMRSSVNQVLKLEGDYPGLHTIPLCGAHHRLLEPLLACALCRRRLTKHHNVHVLHHGCEELNPLLAAAGLPVRLPARPVLCKLCRYYCSLLARPAHNDQHARAYRRKLLQIYNIEVPADVEPDPAAAELDDAANKQRKKARTKSKQRKSTDPDQPSESSEKTESSPEKCKGEEDKLPMEEDIESLISSNKILVPGASKPLDAPPHSDCSDPDTVYDFETLQLPVDKQTELQYLLQKQNNPAQFLHKPNLTQKQRNIMKIQTAPGIQKPGLQHRIHEKNAKKIHKLGQMITKDKCYDMDVDPDKSDDSASVFKNLPLNDECTIETIPNKKIPDINTLKNKWQMSDSFSQVRKNLSELSKKLTVEPKKAADPKYSNPVRRLETNPSISVRELFPGEEEMNLQCNIEFNNVKGVTPEGWEKCNTMIQYDAETKRLWSELQRPYGNQSSFLRHLILLEKYFRSGDLVLAAGAGAAGATYSDAVQARLRAYDNVRPPVSLIEYRKKSSVNGKSLLKSSQQEPEKDPKKFMPPPMLPKPKSRSEKSKKALPPELIAINTPTAQGRKAIQNVLHNIQQLVKGVSAADPTEVAAAPLPAPEPPQEKAEPPRKPDAPKKQRPTSKPWRPTLMPITPENMAKIAREPTQVAVDGRHLPSLVQVMSSGKRFHITLQDYNKMCVMRREKLQQLHDGETKGKKEDTTVVTEIQTSSMLGNGGTLVQNIPSDTDKPKEMPELSQISSNAATILKNVGLKNITIAPIPAKTATVTSQTMSPVAVSPSLLVTSTPMKIPQLGPSVTITSETVLSPNAVITSSMVMPKIPKSLTVIPQTMVPQTMIAGMPHALPPNVVLPQSIIMPQSMALTQLVPTGQGQDQRP